VNIKTYIYKFALFSAFFLNAFTSLAQKDILELLPGADKLIYDEKLKAQRLIGNINFIYQGNKMYCDSAHFYEKTNEVRAYGKVHINKNDTLNLYCDSLYYNGKLKLAKLWGHVRVRDREYKITTDSMDYDVKKGQAVYRHGGKIENILKKEILTSRVGYIYPDSKNFIFSGNVKYTTPDLKMSTDTLKYQYLQKKVYFYGPTNIKTKDATIFCAKGWYHTETEEALLQKNAEILSESKQIKGDSIYYNPMKGIAIGRGNIFYNDTIDPVGFTSQYFYKNDKINKTFLTEKALCQYRMEKDTLFIHADTIFVFNDSLNKLKLVLAYYNAKFYKKDIQGICDSISFIKDTNLLEMYHQPIVWSKNAEIKGVKMNVFIRDSLIDKIEITDKATTIMQVDTAFYNQVGGKKMNAFFKNNELIRVEVIGNSQTIYFPEEKKETDSLITIKRSGMNRIYSSDIKVYLDSGEVIGVNYIQKPDAVFYPIKQINKEEQFIQNFDWKPFLRPKSVEDLFIMID
jgi:lipopolysaccharide assembly outer membrane protein LptD (OstA)